MAQKTVFIVEDDPDIQEVISLILHGNGYDINTCGTAGDLKREMNIQLPDLIVLDVRLPDGNGIEICNEIKKDPTTCEIPIILMSANKYERAETSCANGFISKPFNIGTFKDKIEKLLLR